MVTAFALERLRRYILFMGLWMLLLICSNICEVKLLA